MPRKTNANKLAFKPKNSVTKAPKYQFKRKTTIDLDLTAVADNEYYWRPTISLDQVAGSGEFTALFTMYKINAVKLQLFPSYTSPGKLENGTAQNVLSYQCYDPANQLPAGSTFSKFLEFQNCKVRNLPVNQERPLTTYFKPRYASAAAGGLNKGKWQDTDYPAIPHHGPVFLFKSVGGNFDVAAQIKMEVVVTYYLEFAQPA